MKKVTKKIMPYKGSNGAAMERVFTWLGIKRVDRALTQTCRKNKGIAPAKLMQADANLPYLNEGWHNCFMTQAVGGKKRLDTIGDKTNGDLVRGLVYHLTGSDMEYAPASQKLNSDIHTVIWAFDNNERKFLATAEAWLKKFHV